MKWIPLAMAFATSTQLMAQSKEGDTSAESSPEFVLTFDNPESEPEWLAVNDGVMGGLSQGGGTLEDSKLIFEGSLSLENNGGFSSVRTPTQVNQFDFTGSEGLAFRVRGDGRTYQLRLSSDARHRGSLVSYQCKFETEEQEWTEVQIPFADMKPSWRGRLLSGHLLDTSKISQIGFLIGDKKEGPFRLEVDWMKTVPEKPKKD